jgi:hypothetical protein
VPGEAKLALAIKDELEQLGLQPLEYEHWTWMREPVEASGSPGPDDPWGATWTGPPCARFSTARPRWCTSLRCPARRVKASRSNWRSYVAAGVHAARPLVALRLAPATRTRQGLRPEPRVAHRGKICRHKRHRAQPCHVCRPGGCRRLLVGQRPEVAPAERVDPPLAQGPRALLGRRTAAVPHDGRERR